MMRHAFIPAFAVVDDCLCVGGVALPRLATRVGATPFYAYDRALIRTRIASLREVLGPRVHLHYAVKANPMPALVDFIAPQVDGLDVASGGELKLALDAGMAPERISFAGPGKSEREIAQAIAAGIVLNLESETQAERAAAIGQRLGLHAMVALRINPDFELKSSGMKMGGGPKQFGIDAERVPALLRRLEPMGLDFRGFHIFSGSQNLRAEAIVEAQHKSIALACRLSADAPSPVRILNIGGGFGIPYFPGEEPLALERVGAGLAQALPQVAAALPEAAVVIELGRYIVGEAGIYVCRVLERKLSRDQVFLITDGGLHHHLSASGNFGQVIRKNYPVAVGNKMRGATRESATVVGPLCTPLDLLADRMELARAEPGDLIVVFQSGAYGLSASPTAFLSHPPPLEVLV
ncbi:MAG: pyridoxal-dependent decarboxylase, exosortase A system-associated [Burkholderiales bacterium]|nr:pyridoxal-dependent decarboxylase, exosortase A system-associated [Burkholderiales bacterium]